MSTTQKAVAALLLASLIASIVASLLHARHTAIWLGVPALIMTGWAALGHLVTLDDDSPDGWSNVEGTKRHFSVSLLWLLAEFSLFAITAFFVVFWPF